MTFAQDETSISGSRPREVYTFESPEQTWRLTSSSRAVSLDGQTYHPTTLGRSAAEVTTEQNLSALEIQVAVAHALPQRYLRGGIPPRRINVTVRRKQLNSGEAEQVWIGRVHSMKVEKNVATFLVLSHTGDALQRRIPTITNGRECPHVLYDQNCKVNEASYQISVTVFNVNGLDVLCSSNVAFNVEDWFKWGKLTHVPSGESADITKQTSNLVSLTAGLQMQVGDALLLSAGCSHSIETCLVKFANVPNFGGTPVKPSANPMIPGRKIFSLKQFGID